MIVNGNKVAVIDADDQDQDYFAHNNSKITPKVLGRNSNSCKNQTKILEDDWLSTDGSADEEATTSHIHVDGVISSNNNMVKLNECPMCRRSFPQTQLEAHASDCQGVRDQRKTENQVFSKLTNAKEESRKNDLTRRINSAASGSGVNIKPRNRASASSNVPKSNRVTEEDSKSNDGFVQIIPSPVLRRKVKMPSNSGGAEWASILDE